VTWTGLFLVHDRDNCKDPVKVVMNLFRFHKSLETTEWLHNWWVPK
jgi:hypothetical protein